MLPGQCGGRPGAVLRPGHLPEARRLAPRGEPGQRLCSPPASSPGRLALLSGPRGLSDRGPPESQAPPGGVSGRLTWNCCPGHRLAPGKQAARVKLGPGGLRGHSGTAEDGLGRGRVKHCLPRPSDCFGLLRSGTLHLEGFSTSLPRWASVSPRKN